MAKRISSAFITGATGFIGSQLALHLRPQHIHVRALGLKRNQDEERTFRHLSNAGIDMVEADLDNTVQYVSKLEGIETIFHLAATQHEMNVPDSHYQKVNIEGTRKLIEAAIHAGVKRFIYVSTIGVWGEKAGELHADLLPEPDTVYGRTKLEAEKLVAGYGEKIETVIIRLGETYGPGDMRLLKLFKMTEKGKATIIGRGHNRHHPMFIGDTVRALQQAASVDAALHKTLLLAGHEVVTSEGMISTIAGVMGKKTKTRHLPLLPLISLAWLMEKTLRPLGIQPPLHRRRLGFFIKDQTLDGKKAEEILGFKAQVNFNTGAQLTRDWYKKEKMIA